MEVLKVSATSRPTAVAGAIAGVIRGGKRADVQAIGAGAVNQAVKAVAIAHSYLAPAGVELVCIPEFTDVLINGVVRTAIRLVVEPRHAPTGPIPDIRGPWPDATPDEI